MGKYISIFGLLLFCVFYVVYGYIVNFPQYDDLRVVGTIGLLQFAYSIHTSIKNGQKLISPYIVFLMVMYIFHVGQSLMYPFNVITNRDLVGFMGITASGVFKAQLISFSFLAFFQIGSLLCNIHSYKKAINSSYPKQIIRLKRIGWFLAIVSFYPYYSELIHNAILSMTFGYGALYEGEAKIGFANFGSILADYYIPAIICLYIVYKNNNKARLLIVGILLFSCGVILVTGGRTEAVIILLLLLILHNYLIKSFTRKQLIAIGSFGVIVLILLASIAQMRSNTSRSFNDTFDISENTSNNGAVEAIGEMGGSMFCLIWTDEIVPQTEEYRFGSSYAYAFTSIIPNLGFWDIHPAKKHANLADWLTDKKGLSFGTGYSMIAEAYINFGYFGALLMILMGYLITNVFGRLKSYTITRNVASTAFVLVLFWFSLKIPRNSFIGIVRAIFYFALPIFWYTRGYILKHKI